MFESASALLALSSKGGVCGHCLVTLPLTINEMDLIAAHLNAGVILVVTVWSLFFPPWFDMVPFSSHQTDFRRRSKSSFLRRDFKLKLKPTELTSTRR